MHYILIATEELPLSSHLTMSLAKYFHLGLTLELMSSSWLQVRKWGRVSATIQILSEKNHHLFPGILLSSRMFHRLSTPQTHHCKNKTDIRTPKKTAVTKTGTARNLLIICMCSPEFFSQSFSCHKITWTSTLNNILKPAKMWTPLVLKEQLRQSTTLQCESEPTLLFYFNGL